MITANLTDYQEHPVFLHAVNRELHDAVGKPINADDLLHAIRVFSIVSCQKMFCNVSQVHEVFFNNPDALKEITELSKIGRFIAHSDYGSFDEFRESRMEKFSHSRKLHPAFFDAPSKELTALPHDSMGKSVSTTGHIEKNLVGWLENDPDSSLFKTLSQNDARNLRASEEWIAETLKNRDQKALTFDVFGQTAGGVFQKNAEGAVRRSLTEAYIDSYLVSFDPRCIWGFRGINHFERMKLFAGLNYRFAQAILNGTGIDQFLNNNSQSDFGQLQRLLTEHSEQLAFFRECYAELALVIDENIGDETAWHKCDGIITASIQKLRQSSILQPTRENASYKDVLLNAGETVKKARALLEGSENKLVEKPKQYHVLLAAGETSKVQHEKCMTSESKDKDKQSFWASHVMLVILGGIAVTAAAFFALPEFLPLSGGARISLSIVAGLIMSAIIYWFHPDNYLRRMAFGGFALLTVGGLSYEAEIFGIQALGDSVFKIGNLPSNLMIGGGGVIFLVCIFLDTKVRYFRN